MIRWFAKNDIAANFLLFGILAWGIWSAVEKVALEVQPAYSPEKIYINIDYRGASPADVEKAVVLPVESALEGLPGVKTIESRANDGNARIIVVSESKRNLKPLLEEVKTRVDRINSFPDEVDPPRVYIPDTSQWYDVIKIAIQGDMDEADLLHAARTVRDDLIAMKGISQASVLGASPLEISVEADPRLLRAYDLTFADLGNAIRKSSIDLPAGRIQTDEGRLTIRSKGQAYTREDFEKIVISNSKGSEVRLSTVAKVIDGSEESKKIMRFNGKPCLLVEVLRLGNENALEIASKVKEYVASSDQRFPEGVSLSVWDDSSEELEGRLGTLLTSMLQGGVLVLVVLGLFLRPMLAFWVTLGIPVAFAGGFIVMPYFDLTANVMSIFGFIIVIGLVVDDAIVTAENVYTKLKTGMDPLEAATEGASEVATPVTFGVITTIVAFVPLMFFEGFYGAFTKQIPPIVAAVLVFSLIESKLGLPCHLKYVKVNRKKLNAAERFQKRIADSLETFVVKVYEPVLRLAANHRYITLSLFLALGMASIGYFSSGKMGFVNMPSIDRNRIVAMVRMTRDTKVDITEARTQQVADALSQVKREFTDPATGDSLITDTLTSAGGWSGRKSVEPHTGFVVIGVTDPGKRSEPGPKNSEIAARWTELIGEMPDVQNFWISGDRGRGMGGDDDLESISLEIRGRDSEEKDEVVREIEEMLESYDGIESAWSRSGGTSDELLITIRPEGEALGLTQQALSRQVRSAFFGEQAQRVQRERDDIRVMIRLPRAQRESLATLDSLRIRTPSGGQAPFHTIATATYVKARSRIERVDGSQVIEISAKPVDESIDVVAISKNLAGELDRILNKHRDLSWRYTGYVADHEDTKKRSIYGGLALFFTLYALLAIPFRSLYQPLFVMLAVPFGAIGALFGHLIMDITPSYLSVFGILALAGVVVNDSLVMVDFINQKTRAGGDLFESVISSGTRRFRPIFLTSATTFAGLMPLIFDRSLQAQFLIPMAVSLAFGILFATAITLFLIPCSYLAAEEIRVHLGKAWVWWRYPGGKPSIDEK
ncbi:MAG: efflux RND transporter permease subunit [Verrucomicrobia bacterium]|nr:efflux RND transporter permease subunit [Verrucomicrobiota bacterium]|tara:strand:+ start:16928 stop:20095 length:3168 start_codon:yes stop_codon:yes gene_type:complete